MLTVIKCDRLIDGLSDAAIPEAIVALDGPSITYVGPAAAAPDYGNDVHVIQLADSTVMPGLIDAHVHITSDGGSENASNVLGDVTTSFAALALRGAANARRTLHAGYTTVRDLHTFGYADVALRDILATGRLEGCRLRVSGQGLCITGGHMDQIRLPVHISALGRIGVCDTPDGFRQAVREHVRMGVDQIKINSDVGRPDPSTPWVQEMSYEEMKAACDEAHNFGKHVAAHTTGGPPIEDALRAGVDSIEHGHWLTDRAIELMLERGAYYVPTLLVNSRNFPTIPAGKQAPSNRKGEWSWYNASYEAKWDSLERAKDAGVKIVAGTDAGFIVDHGENAFELVELVKGGLTEMQAIVSATRTAAELLQLNDEVGTLEAGKVADLIIVQGDPLADISVLCNTNHITHVFQSGKQVKAPGIPADSVNVGKN